MLWDREQGKKRKMFLKFNNDLRVQHTLYDLVIDAVYYKKGFFFAWTFSK